MIAEQIKYRATGIHWTPEIPENWGQMRLKNICTDRLQYGINVPSSKYSDDGIRFLRTTDIDEDGNIIDEGIYIPKEEVEQSYLLQQGDLLFSRSGTVGRCYIHNTDNVYSYAGFLVRFRPENKLLSKWMFYYSFTKEFKYQVNSEAIVSTISNFNGNKYAALKLFFPKDENELKNILDYLDHKTQQIENFIAKRQQFINLLREQRQSVINDVLVKDNENWNFCRLKNIATINEVTLLETTNDNYLMKYIDIANVNSDGNITQLQDFTFKKAPSRARRVVKKDDVIISTVRTYLRAIAIIINEEDNLIASTGFAVLKHMDCIIPELLIEILRTDFFIDQVIANSYGVSYPAINSTTLGTLKISYPNSVEEQQKIVAYIKQETATIDTAIAKTQKEIELIKEYKEALISEAVMGKVKFN